MAGRVAAGETVIAVDIHNSRLELAREPGATHTVTTRDVEIGFSLVEGWNIKPVVVF